MCDLQVWLYLDVYTNCQFISLSQHSLLLTSAFLKAVC